LLHFLWKSAGLARAHAFSFWPVATRRTRIGVLLRKLVKVAAPSLRGGGTSEKLA